MLLDEPEHMTQRKFMLPGIPWAEDERLRRDDGGGRARRDRELAGRRTFRAWPRMQAISNEVVMRATFGTPTAPDPHGCACC